MWNEPLSFLQLEAVVPVDSDFDSPSKSKYIVRPVVDKEFEGEGKHTETVVHRSEGVKRYTYRGRSGDTLAPT